MKKSLVLIAILMLNLSIKAQINQPNKSRATVFLNENFENGTMPEGWTEKIGNATQGYTFNTDASSSGWSIPPHTTYACISDDACNCDMSETYLITKPMDFSEASNLILKFDYYTQIVGNSPIPIVKTTTDGGATWNDLKTLTPPSFEWKHLELNISSMAGQNNVQIGFYFSDGGNYVYGLAIDNVQLYAPEQKDLTITKIIPDIVAVGASPHPLVTIYNLGLSEVNDYQVKLTDNESYEETIDISEKLAPSAQTSITFPKWTPSAGTKTLTATIIYADDQDPENNQININCDVIPIKYNAEVYISMFPKGATEGKYGTQNLNNPTSFTYTGKITNSPYPSSEEYNGTYIYRSLHNQSISIISPEDGSELMNMPIKGIGDYYPEGLAWDWDNNIMYVSSSTPAAEAPNELGTIDLNTFEYTKIGSLPRGLIAIDFANDGFIYGPSMMSSSLYKIKPDDANYEEIGYVGININFSQDVSYDRINNKLYALTAQDLGGGKIDFLYGTYNLTTGAFEQIAKIDDQGATLCIVNPSETSIKRTENTLNISPNPTNGILNINATGYYKAEIIDFTGKIILSENITNHAHFDISSMKSGIYFVRISNENKTTVMKLIKK